MISVVLDSNTHISFHIFATHTVGTELLYNGKKMRNVSLKVHFLDLKVLKLSNHHKIVCPRAQLPPAAGFHPAEAMLLPGLWRDPWAAPQHVQEDVSPVDVWVLWQ